MNRRELLRGVGGTGIGLLALPVTFAANSDEGDDHKCDDMGVCASRVIATAKEYIAETGEWNQYARERLGRRMLYTICGGTCCEIELRTKHPDWTFTARLMSAEERRTFRNEYGRSNWLLLGLNFKSSLEVRGFVLNGRREGWNVSVRTISE